MIVKLPLIPTLFLLHQFCRWSLCKSMDDYIFLPKSPIQTLHTHTHVQTQSWWRQPPIQHNPNPLLANQPTLLNNLFEWNIKMSFNYLTVKQGIKTSIEQTSSEKRFHVPHMHLNTASIKCHYPVFLAPPTQSPSSQKPRKKKEKKKRERQKSTNYEGKHTPRLRLIEERKDNFEC